ncbi:MAG: hypothetical protein GOV01_01290 [Candidatus Altiarchaeota archaeon]|nr:hypothetical protein [Candidatus Altiarchaeota archaeon]
MMWLYKVAYVGWMFKGSQIQPSSQHTVEGELHRVMGGRCRLSSRTDAGVSAKGNILLSEDKLQVGKINNKLSGVKIWAESEVSEFPEVKHRHYRYFIVNKISKKELIPLLKFNGTHDFKDLTRSRKDTVRTVSVKLGKNYIDFFSKGFLWNQIRRMVGTLSGRTAPPEPLVLLDIVFKEEPTWKYYPKWLAGFEKQQKDFLAKSLVLGTFIIR